MRNIQALDIARAMLLEIRDNLADQQKNLGDQADKKYFDKESEKLFLIQKSLNDLRI